MLVRYYRQKELFDKFFSVALKNVAQNGCSEVCCELGAYYLYKEDYEEACLWYYNAAFEVSPVLDIATGGGIPLRALSEAYTKWADAKQAQLDRLPPSAHGKFAGDEEMIANLRANAADYKKRAEEWMLPEL